MSDFLNKNGGIVTLAKASVVPIGLYAFSKYKDYDSKKTKKVVLIGSVVILGALVVNGISGMWSGNTISKRIFSRVTGKKNNQKEVLKPIAIENLSLKKPCKKWVQPACSVAPCPPTCAEY